MIVHLWYDDISKSWKDFVNFVVNLCTKKALEKKQSAYLSSVEQLMNQFYTYKTSVSELEPEQNISMQSVESKINMSSYFFIYLSLWDNGTTTLFPIWHFLQCIHLLNGYHCSSHLWDIIPQGSRGRACSSSLLPDIKNNINTLFDQTLEKISLICLIGKYSSISNKIEQYLLESKSTFENNILLYSLILKLKG